MKSVLAAAAVSLAFACTVYAADNVASVMKMQKLTGTVDVFDSSGKAVSVFQNMNLRNGYGIGTQEESYAWISLDDTKLAKLDAVSEAGIRKKKKQLEVLLESGNLFFDVSEPLEDDESFNIRTSTTAIGIRGTSGWVEIIDPDTVRVSVLEGTVQVSVVDPLTNKVKYGSISAGETALCVVYDEKLGGGGAVRHPHGQVCGGGRQGLRADGRGA